MDLRYEYRARSYGMTYLTQERVIRELLRTLEFLNGREFNYPAS